MAKCRLDDRTGIIIGIFARRGNRFWPALYRAGILPELIDPSDGLSDRDRATVLDAGVGITNVVSVATARADELTADQLRHGGERLVRTIEECAPRVVAVLGITAYRQAFGRPATMAGRQADTIGGAALWVLGNPSGLNAHETVESLADAYRAAAIDAGLVIHPPAV